MSRMPVKPKRDLVLEASSRAKNLQIDEIHSIKAAWDKFDLNSDGEVKADEVAEFLRHLNINVVSEAQKQKILNELDRNRNGTIEFIEFVLAYEKGFFKNI